jgi:hypothetical protein
LVDFNENIFFFARAPTYPYRGLDRVIRAR